jgi:hypothetical protein
MTVKTHEITQILVDALKSVVTNVFVGSLRFYTKLPNRPFLVVVPSSLRIEKRYGTEFIQVNEVYRIHVVTDLGSQPFIQNMRLTAQVCNKVATLYPQPQGFEFGEIEITGVEYDSTDLTDLGCFVTTVEVRIVYYSPVD